MITALLLLAVTVFALGLLLGAGFRLGSGVASTLMPLLRIAVLLLLVAMLGRILR